MAESAVVQGLFYCRLCQSFYYTGDNCAIPFKNLLAEIVALTGFTNILDSPRIIYIMNDIQHIADKEKNAWLYLLNSNMDLNGKWKNYQKITHLTDCKALFRVLSAAVR